MNTGVKAAMNETDTAGLKRELRRAMKARRDAIEPALRKQYSARIRERLLTLPQVAQARRIFAFVSCGSEVCTHTLVRGLLDEKRMVCAPYIAGRTRMEARRLERWEDLVEDRMGILAPVGGSPCEGPFDLSITPGLAFTTSGARLGYGAGYYDRWFAAHPETCRVAVAFEAQLVESIPTDATDLPVHYIVTEERLLETGVQQQGTGGDKLR
ncbi:MAG: 5-formyltetrahydrofolate cyclo-ligase [Gammaproteobacteria bacterium]|nr:MAG: 5-formyltetrahydrofolate cyclo-ligase [Gammaproteobacteria bacterium]